MDNNVRTTTCRAGDDDRLNTVDITDTVRSNDLFRWARGDNPTFVEEEELPTIGRRNVDVVGDAEDR